MYAIETRGLCKRYKGKTAVENLDIAVPQGAIYGFIGRNGSGKTTTQRMVCGLAKPTSGEISLFGKPVTDTHVRRMLGVLIEEPGYYPHLTARENVVLRALCIGLIDTSRAAEEAIEAVGLSASAKRKAKNLSLGQRQRLGLAMAMLGHPKLLVLDEPINGLDPEGIVQVRETIENLVHEHGVTVFMSSHILGELGRLATHYGVIREGRLVEQLSAKELKQRLSGSLHVSVSDAATAAEVLKECLKLSPEECLASSEDEIVMQNAELAGDVNRVLVRKGFTVSGVRAEQQDIESYFIDLMGGEADA